MRAPVRATKLRLPVVSVDASALFLARLAGVTDPEQKRKIIGAHLHRGVRGAGGRAGRVRVPRPGHALSRRDRVGVGRRALGARSRATTTSAACPSACGSKLVEPLRELFKDEVRAVGRELGLDEEFVVAPAVPGPGPGRAHPRRGDAASGWRCCAAPTRSSPRRCRRHGWYTRLWQSFAVLLPVQSVGVMGDERTYEYTVAVRAVESRDGMTADWARLPHELLARDLVAHRQRGEGHQPGRLRHQLQAAVDDRVGVTRRTGVGPRTGRGA